MKTLKASKAEVNDSHLCCKKGLKLNDKVVDAFEELMVGVVVNSTASINIIPIVI